MSLIRLLAIGHSFEAAKSQPYRFNKRQHSLLPKFNAKETATPVAARPLLPGRRKRQKANAGPSLIATVTVGKQELKLAPTARFEQRAKSGSRDAPVQIEFCLDRLQVVRNDLTESDLEAVPVDTEPRIPEPGYAPVKSSGGRRSSGGWFQQVSNLVAAARALF